MEVQAGQVNLRGSLPRSEHVLQPMSSMSHSELRSIVGSSMYPYIVAFARAVHAFSAGIICHYCRNVWQKAFVPVRFKGAIKAHIHLSLYESNTLQEQDAALLFLSGI